MDRIVSRVAVQKTIRRPKNPKKVVVVGVSGAPGSFSEEAGRAYIRKMGLKGATINHLLTVEKVLAALEQGDIDHGVFPVANSSMGIVLEAIKAVSQYRFTVKKTFSISVHQCLLVKKGVQAADITRIVSQAPALEQCTLYLTNAWPKTKRGTYADTAAAAKALAEGVLPKTTAVVASRTAAQIYGLKILKASIQDRKDNTTFFVAAVR